MTAVSPNPNFTTRLVLSAWTAMRCWIATAIVAFAAMTANEACAGVLNFDGTPADTEIIDDLKFDVDRPDALAPTVAFVQPANHQNLTGEQFLIELHIEEDRQLRTVRLSIGHNGDSQSLNLPFHPNESAYRVGPFRTGPLPEGANTLTVNAEDYAGNIGTTSITVNRVQIEGTLTFPVLPPNDAPVIVPRMPGRAVVPIELLETFPGSLTGRGEIEITVINTEDVHGSGLIRDPLYQPESAMDFEVFSFTYLGDATVEIQATEKETGRVLSTASFRACFTPTNPIDCDSDLPYYQPVDHDELTAEINEGIKRKLGRGSKVIIGTQFDGGGNEIRIPDPDVGTLLLPMPFDVKFVDCNDNGIFDDLCDSVYRDNDGDNKVSDGDERLANSTVFRDGTSVLADNGQWQTPDLGLRLHPFGPDVLHADPNINGDFDPTEAIYRDVDGSGDVSLGDPDTGDDNDVRLANSPIGRSDIRRLNDMTIVYKKDLYGRGQIRVSQKYLATKTVWDNAVSRFDVDAEIELIADLRLSLDTSSIADRIRFDYTSYQLRAKTDAIGNVGATAAEDEFNAVFKEDFRAGLTSGIQNRIGALNLPFLQDAYITNVEFGLGFCIPASSFPGDPNASASTTAEGQGAMTPMASAFANAFDPPFIRIPRPMPEPLAPTANAATGMCGSGVGLSLSFGMLGWTCMTGSSTGFRKRRIQKNDM